MNHTTIKRKRTKGMEGKGREEKGREGKRREGKGREMELRRRDYCESSNRMASYMTSMEKFLKLTSPPLIDQNGLRR
jgi:hypothetical protein